MFEFVTASHKEDVLRNNLMRSEVIQRYPLTVQRGYTNVAQAYNEASLTAPVVIYVHNDVFLPPSFEDDLIKALDNLFDWSVLGVAGVSGPVRRIHGYISDRGKVWGSSSGLPHVVDTLDEMLLITHGDFIFDENLPQDFYGADICMQAKQDGGKCYAINAYCEHNSSRPMGGRTESFYTSQDYFRKKWREFLPVSTTCAQLI
jgi:hypothetical protein